MAALTPQEIATGAACFECIPDKLSALLYIFDEIRILQGGSEMTPGEISEASACYCIEGEWAALLYLANAIVTSSGAGNFTYTMSAIDPVAAPPTLYGQHYNTVSQVLWQWDGAAWV